MSAGSGAEDQNSCMYSVTSNLLLSLNGPSSLFYLINWTVRRKKIFVGFVGDLCFHAYFRLPAPLLCANTTFLLVLLSLILSFLQNNRDDENQDIDDEDGGCDCSSETKGGFGRLLFKTCLS